MAQNALLMRPWNFEVANAGAFTAPVMAGVEAGVRDRQQGIENERQNKLLGFQEKRLGMDVEKANEERMQRVKQQAGNLALLALQNPEAYAGKWGSVVDTHLAAMRKRDPNAALDPSYYDPKTGPMRVLADAGMANTWMDYQIRQQSAANEKARLGLAYSADARAKASHDAQMSQYENMPPQARAQAASTLGLTPGTPNYNAFIATGKYAPPESDNKIMPIPDGGSLALVNAKTGTARTIAEGNSKIDATTKKAIDEADDFVAQTQTAVGSLKEALRLNSIAYDGVTAGSRAMVNNNIPFSSRTGSSATVQLENVVTNQALSSLRATFGGNPTEGERKILMDVAGSINMNAVDRQAIYARALAAAQARLKINQQKAEALRAGTYFKPGGQPSAVNEPQNYTPGAAPAGAADPLGIR